MSLYELAILGDASPAERARLTDTLQRMIAGFGLELGRDVTVRDGANIGQRNRHAACVAVYFGSTRQLDVDAARLLAADSVPIIPTVDAGADILAQTPLLLQPLNALRRRAADAELVELASAMLECVGLLRRQRRAFVSYRRAESRAAALQLHDLMSARGFDVFLDTHDIRPGDPFQEILWQRLVDSDVMLMLDTPTYFDSKWTRQEIGRALAKEIHVLRVVWPSHQPKALTSLAETVYLDPADLQGIDGPLVQTVADRLILAVESLRSRSIAARYMGITGRLRAELERIEASVEGVGAHRAIAIRLSDGRRLWAYPIVGIPTAELLNDVADKARRADHGEQPVLVYDHVGIRDYWAAHLKWLDDNIRSVRAIKVLEAAWTLAAWEDA